jgi:lysophospholipid acyltransferase (LPLAT)-like uncharacterized protein
MKIRSPWLQKLTRLAGAWLLHFWMATLHHQGRRLANHGLPRRGKPRAIYITWHEYLLLPLYVCANTDMCFLLSRSSDGQLLSAALRHFGIAEVSGSAANGGVKALLRLMRAAQRLHLGLIPDGPRGPRRKIKPGLIYLAAQTGLPIIPIGFAYNRPWRLKSWDCFALPRPFSRAASVVSDAVHVPKQAGKQELEAYRRLVEDKLEQATSLAEGLAETGIWLEPTKLHPATQEHCNIEQHIDSRPMRLAA